MRGNEVQPVSNLADVFLLVIAAQIAIYLVLIFYSVATR